MATKHKTKKQTLIDVLLVTIGTIISAFSFKMIIQPAGILSGGLTGISQFLHHFLPVSVGVFYLLLNIPLLILGYKFLGKRFSLYTIYSTLLLSALMMLLPQKSILTDDILLSALFGGFIGAFGCGIVLRCGGSQGGIDILARIIAKQKNISVGNVNMLINGCIVTASGFIFGAEIALYTIVQIFCASQTYNFVLNHVNRISLMIISEKGVEISEEINNQLGRGTTYWHGNGGYTEKDKIIVFCVVTKSEMATLKQIVREMDEKAFVNINSTQTVIGRFHEVW